MVSLKKTVIVPEGHARPMGHYSPGIKIDLGSAALLLLSGQLPIDAKGAVVGPDDAGAQAEHTFGLIAEILKSAGMSFDDVVKAQIFLTHIGDFPRVSAVRDRYFASSRPVSTLVEVKGLAKPGCRLEIEVIAVQDRSAS